MENNIVNYCDEDIELTTDIRDLSDFCSKTSHSYLFVFCGQGEVQFRMNGKTVLLKERNSYISVPNSRIGHILVSPDTKLAVLRLSQNLVHGLIHTHLNQWNDLLYVRKNNWMECTEEHLQQMQYYYALLQSKVYGNDLYHKEIMQTIIKAMLFEILSLMVSVRPSLSEDDKEQKNRTHYHFKCFLNILSSTVKKHHKVEYYAAQLCITPKYLSCICKECSQKTASKWINDLTNEDIRYYLVSTDFAVKEIADKLGFEDFSFFCKYVRKHFHYSPVEYRKLFTGKK